MDLLPQGHMTYREAAVVVLKEASRPLHVNEIVRIAIEKGILEPGGPRPEATMGSRIYTSIQKSGTVSPFIRVGPSIFGLREWQQQPIGFDESQDESSPSTNFLEHPFVVKDEVTALSDELHEAQHDSDHSRRYEIAIEAALKFLGFDTRLISGSGNTDVLLTAYLGAERYRVVVDAKSSRHTKIQDSQIDWLSLETHAKLHETRHIAVVASAYGGGNLRQRANQYGVTLLTTENLCQVIKWHKMTPFTLMDLQLLFTEPGIPNQALIKLEQISTNVRSHWEILLEIVRQIDAYNRARPEGMIAQADNLHYLLISRFGPAKAPSVGEIQDALTFLSSRAISILRRADTTPGYLLTMSFETAIRRIKSIAFMITDFANQEVQDGI